MDAPVAVLGYPPIIGIDGLIRLVTFISHATCASQEGAACLPPPPALWVNLPKAQQRRLLLLLVKRQMTPEIIHPPHERHAERQASWANPDTWHLGPGYLSGVPLTAAKSHKTYANKVVGEVARLQASPYAGTYTGRAG